MPLRNNHADRMHRLFTSLPMLASGLFPSPMFTPFLTRVSKDHIAVKPLCHFPNLPSVALGSQRWNACSCGDSPPTSVQHDFGGNFLSQLTKRCPSGTTPCSIRWHRAACPRHRKASETSHSRSSACWFERSKSSPKSCLAWEVPSRLGASSKQQIVCPRTQRNDLTRTHHIRKVPPRCYNWLSRKGEKCLRTCAALAWDRRWT